MALWETNIAQPTGQDIRIPIDLHRGVGRFLDSVNVRIMEIAVLRAADSQSSLVRAEDIVEAASVVLADAPSLLESFLRRIDTDDVRRRAS